MKDIAGRHVNNNVLKTMVELAHMRVGEKDLVILKQGDAFFVGSRYEEDGEPVADIRATTSLRMSRMVFANAIKMMAGDLPGADVPDLFRSQITIEQGKKELFDLVDEGKGPNCALCGRKVKLYVRKLNSSMARGLFWLVHRSVEWDGYHVKKIGWVNVPQEAPREFVRSFQIGTLAYWNLVEQEVNEESGVKVAGMWRPTPQGAIVAQFPKKAIVRSHVKLLNGEFRGYSGELVSIKDCLGEHFNLEELMRGGGFGEEERTGL